MEKEVAPGNKEARVLEASKEKLKKDAEEIITSFFHSVLDLSEVAIDSQRYKIFRSKILRLGNDSIRELKKVLDKNYQILYTPTNEDVVQVQKPVVRSRNS